MRRSVAVLFLCGVVALDAQPPTKTELRFEAASIKPAPQNGPPISGTTIRDNRLRATNVTLFGLILAAYFGDTFVSEDQFVGGPDWIRTERYEINAVAEGKPTRTEFQMMLRSLLADRFRLVVSRGQRDLPVFVMSLARADGRLGPKLTRVNVDCTEYHAAFARNERLPSRPDPNSPPQCDTLSVSRPTGTRIAGRAVEIGVIGRTVLGGRVIDRTGLTGTFDFEIEFVREPLGQAPDAAAVLGDGVTAATALREQLGLRFDRQTAPVEVLVIDSVQQPTEN